MGTRQTTWAKPLGVRQSHCRLVIVFMLLALLPAHAAERFPQPEFETEHVVPEPTEPAARNPFLPYQDVAVLTLALSLSSYFVLRRRSRRAVFALMVCCLVYFGFWKKGCICPVGSTQNILLSLSDPSYVVPLSVLLLFLLPLVFALFFGRVFCASVCPLGAIQDGRVLDGYGGACDGTSIAQGGQDAYDHRYTAHFEEALVGDVERARHGVVCAAAGGENECVIGPSRHARAPVSMDVSNMR